MRETVLKHLRSSFQRYLDLVNSLPDDSLGHKLPGRSNTLGGQAWCLIGARQSYTRALQFETVIAAIEWTAERDELLLTLLDHETQHEGQIIRYAYALGLPFPTSWSTRGSLQN